MTAAMPLLTTRGLDVHIGSRCLVRSLDLTLYPGEFWCLLGPNGAGKSMLLHTLVGARAPSGGQIEIAGRALTRHRLSELARWRGFMPQRLHDAFSAPVFDVVLQGRHPHLSRWHWEGQADHALARAALAKVGLPGFEQRDVTTLSGGERQRVALATLLAQDPALALLDEPLAHLDLAQQIRMLEALKSEVSTNFRTVLMSIHDLSLAQRAASHVLLLAGAGRALAGPVADIMTEEHLSTAFGLRLRRREVDGQPWWLPC